MYNSYRNIGFSSIIPGISEHVATSSNFLGRLVKTRFRIIYVLIPIGKEREQLKEVGVYGSKTPKCI